MIIKEGNVSFDLWKHIVWEQVETVQDKKQSSKYDSIIRSMSQLRRHSLDSKLNLRSNRKEVESESSGDKKSTDKTTSSAKSLKTTGAMRQTSIKEQLEPKTSSAKNNKRNREDNSSSQKSPLKKRANCETSNMPVETTIESTEIKDKELKPEHEELKQQNLRESS